MNERDVRTLAWFAGLICFFPVWILAQRAFSWLVIYLRETHAVVLPQWLYSLATILLLAIILVGTGYIIAHLLDRKYPDSKPTSAAWDEQGK